MSTPADALVAPTTCEVSPTTGSPPCAAAALERFQDRLSRAQEHTLHRWFWLRLASGAGAVRDQPTVESHVRAAVVAHGWMTEESLAALSWHELLERLAAQAGREARVVRRIIARLRTRFMTSSLPVELGATACDILILGTAMSRERKLQELGTLFVLDGMEDVVARVAEAIDANEMDVADALHPAAPLKFWGLLRCPALVAGVGQAIEPVRTIRHHLYGRLPLDEALLRPFLKQLEVTRHESVDLTHLTLASQVAQAFLNSGPSARVLLHGKPGVGTSEFIRDVIRRLEWRGYTTDLRAISETQLLNDRDLGAEAAYSVLRRRPHSVIVFDHATHILRSSLRDLRNYMDLIGVPTVWVSENLELIDADLLSRFDQIFEIQAPPRAASTAILRRALEGLGVSESRLEAVAAADDFVPATATRLARALPVLINHGMAPDAALDALRHLPVSRSGKPRPGPQARRSLPYRMPWIRASADLERLITGLTQVSAGTLLFSGPPGTGKTEFARHLAARLGRTLLIRSAADLNGHLVGETEKAIARAFGEAQRDGSILLIDEVDSFLRSRESAVRTWEVSQVNEMLTQLDRFEGIAILTTNAPESLDAAVVRRIDRKVEFNHLAKAYRWEVFTAAAEVLAVPIVDPVTELRGRVESLSELALGDVAVVIRGERLEPCISCAGDLCNALRVEIRRRLKTQSPIGFTEM